MSIRFKLLCGFGFLVLLTLALAYIAAERTSELGRMVVDVYDRPLMSINHARTAETGFNKALSVFARDSQRTDAATATTAQITALLDDVESDLGVVSERFATPAVTASLAGVRKAIGEWKSLSLASLAPEKTALSLPTTWTLDQKAAAVLNGLDDLVQIVAASGFEFRVEAEARLRASEQLFHRLAAGAAGLGIFLTLLFARMIAHPIRRMALALAAIKGGDSQIDIPCLTRLDEVGAVARGVQLISGVAHENQLTVAAVNSSNTMMMIADGSGKIVFISASLLRLLERLEPSLAAGRHGFRVSDLRGAQLEQLDTNPRLRREIIVDGGASRKMRYAFEGATALVDASRVTDADGRMLGETLLWRDVTNDLSGEAEVADLVSATQAGDFSRRLSLSNKDGFIKDIAVGLNEVSDMVERALGDCALSLQSMAAGDLTRHVKGQYQGVLDQIAGNINATLQRLSETVGTISGTAAEVTMAAHEINSGAGNLSTRTSQQAASLEETAATADDLAGSVKLAAESSRKAASLAQEAIHVAAEGGSVVTSAIGAMARIEEGSRKISDITHVIEEIAFQTNLLALNASVEAARAGEAGRGFAVVAAEVRTLAQNSGRAAKDIAGLIKASASEVTDGVRLVRAAGDALERIVAASNNVSAMVAQVSAATTEQAHGIGEMSQAITQMDQMTQQNAALSEESAATAATLIHQIGQLNALVATFKTAGNGSQTVSSATARRVA